MYRPFIVFCTLILQVFFSHSQQIPLELLRSIPTAIPYANLSADARASGMGEIGVVAAAPYYSSAQTQNPALLARGNRIALIRFNHAPQFKEYLDSYPHYLSDIGLAVSVAHRHVLGLKSRTFFLGESVSLDPWGERVTVSEATYLQQSLSYGFLASNNISFGLNFNTFKTKETQRLALPPVDPRIPYQPIHSYSLDLGFNYRSVLYQDELNSWQGELGFALRNLGPKVSQYEGFPEFVPAQMLLGFRASWQHYLAPETQLNIDLACQLDKLLVPANGDNLDELTAVQGWLQSFTDAENGFQEELWEINRSVGAEIRVEHFKWLLAIRGGLFREHPVKGGRQQDMLGFSVGRGGFRFHYAYSAPFFRNEFVSTQKVSIEWLFEFEVDKKQS